MAPVAQACAPVGQDVAEEAMLPPAQRIIWGEKLHQLDCSTQQS